ncbi:hypothetical protein HRR83_006376 [Exophiala dermatitidis]|uniref:C2H2-type domain-containing protein n=2 Tax=Exophiala dermatitidis TaxID=5970 RepID=H6CA51_EXODN|nr:uncharacterized protein HMPREF1120_07990 [Exophiala dermatitidis NIH/UT8656]KAJ4509380.1 hypothetical protein HRR73_007234 [Exophiala dermatitidis]EHY60015.1 hypothetical protein HMPREF1120_07990 [Exophiala dermatitidis NIH/UT8656]KAJ4509567.1 hypothetical protein HRR74_007348 [Exophiala dermatitidis]KAJ4530571.1 hypothetical protein HRR76_008275 [Exophiala dermatitidis]KAJ4545259.1 hypothetical protein HRR77_005112 [Exophiala dermatitidis]
MDRGASEYAQSDQSSVATYTTQDARSANISTSNTPQSDYGLTPSSARSSGFPSEHLRYSQYTHAPQHSGAVGTMAQPTNPSISQASPTYPPYSPYPQGQDMQHAYQPQHPPYMQQRPPHEQWAGYPPQHGMPGPYPHPGPGVQGPPQTSAASRTGQVYSFVPIPGAQQHKRPRRRYEEIERMYKCGWNGCEKAYGTLNHLNAHVTMQSHGTKRTPEEFKEIRKEWKARKKEEENARKAEEERQRAAAQANQVDGGQPADAHQVPAQGYQQNGARPSLPPIGYQSAEGHAQGQYAQPQAGMVYPPGNGQMGSYANYPSSPYGQQGQVYQQRQY